MAPLIAGDDDSEGLKLWLRAYLWVPQDGHFTKFRAAGSLVYRRFRVLQELQGSSCLK